MEIKHYPNSHTRTLPHNRQDRLSVENINTAEKLASQRRVALLFFSLTLWKPLEAVVHTVFFRGCVYACECGCNPHSVNPSKYKGNLNRKPLSSLSSIPCWQSMALGQPVHWKDFKIQHLTAIFFINVYIHMHSFMHLQK